jgi:hypothetical protein
VNEKACNNCVSYSHATADCPHPAPPLGQLNRGPRYRLLGTSSAAHEVARQLASLRDLPARPAR